MSEISSNMTSIVPDNNRKRQSKKRGPADKIMLAPLFDRTGENGRKFHMFCKELKKINKLLQKKPAKIQLNA